MRDGVTVFNLLVEGEGLCVGMSRVSDLSLCLKNGSKIREVTSLTAPLIQTDIEFKILFVTSSRGPKIIVTLREQSHIVQDHPFSIENIEFTIQTQGLVVI